MVSPADRAHRRADADLLSFLNTHGDRREKIKRALRGRSFGTGEDSVIGEVTKFLDEAGSRFEPFARASDVAVKTEFLKSLIRAWEIADATGTFNEEAVSTFRTIRAFSETCLEQIVALPRAGRIHASKKGYWQEVARAGLIHIAELYRSQRLDECRRELSRLLAFVENKLIDKQDKSPKEKQDKKWQGHGILGQVFYFSSKANRFAGQLDVAEDDLIKAAEHYSARAMRLAAAAKDIEARLRQEPPEGGPREALKNELRDINEKRAEVTLRTGVVEVSRAWLLFSQANYRAAKHSAHAALLLLSPSSDELTQYHAQLVSAAVDRVRSDSCSALEQTVSRLTVITDYFRKRGHSRLQARAEYELLLALILLDSARDTEDYQPTEYVTPMKEAEKYLLTRAASTTSRWASLKLTLHSRVLRRKELKKRIAERDFSAAIEHAERALREAQKSQNGGCEIEALIASAEAYYEQGMAEVAEPQPRKSTDARGAGVTPTAGHGSARPADSFSAAKNILARALGICLKTDFPELMAIVRLLLARIAVRMALYDEANYHLHEFGQIKVQDHAWIQRLHKKVFSEYHREDYLVLQEEQLNKEKAFLKLKKFLIDKAAAKVKKEKGKVTDEAIAEVLDVSRMTVWEWRKLPDE